MIRGPQRRSRSEAAGAVEAATVTAGVACEFEVPPTIVSASGPVAVLPTEALVMTTFPGAEPDVIEPADGESSLGSGGTGAQAVAEGGEARAAGAEGWEERPAARGAASMAVATAGLALASMTSGEEDAAGGTGTGPLGLAFFAIVGLPMAHPMSSRLRPVYLGALTSTLSLRSSSHLPVSNSGCSGRGGRPAVEGSPSARAPRPSSSSSSSERSSPSEIGATEPRPRGCLRGDLRAAAVASNAAPSAAEAASLAALRK